MFHVKHFKEKNWREIVFGCFLGLFLLTWPLERRYIFNLEEAEIGRHFNEWLSISLYLSDIFFVGLLLAWILWRGREISKTFKSIYGYNSLYKTALEV